MIKKGTIIWEYFFDYCLNFYVNVCNYNQEIKFNFYGETKKLTKSNEKVTNFHLKLVDYNGLI